MLLQKDLQDYKIKLPTLEAFKFGLKALPIRGRANNSDAVPDFLPAMVQ